ncbi:hypothetical protein KSD_13870 [Ktedonobacter sp. SOSP1-85]|uniref:mannosyltransferase family protein n=1 Tax=Ktedonobacter sp. SOSP1-85 TaxID=2778367 RepID=UPI001916B61C|nr:mannosyltransferase family protein [Ktedonobacter sp. SOSP1-85]GHO73616.1 hypothetical protein KSD_13870 [Ktedonobacter sp. SOSP1-85]
MLAEHAEIAEKREVVKKEEASSKEQGWRKWGKATLAVLPLYLGIHVAFFIVSCLAILFQVNDFAWSNMPLATLWREWRHWDTGHFIYLAQNGYTESWRTAFFPLQPMLIAALTPLTHDNPLIASMCISNIAFLVLLVVFYRLVKEDFDQERAERAILYLVVFPTAFFLAAGYTDALFLALALSCFYNMRRGHWWLAGLFGFFASLTRSAGVFLLVPFAYEYARQRQFALKRLLQPAVLSMGLVPLGTGLFAAYCYLRFGDPLAFSHAQAHWNRQLTFPWMGLLDSALAVKRSSGFLSFQSLRNLIDLGCDLLILGLLILCLVGPWRLPRAYLSYVLYGLVLWLFFHLVTKTDERYALESMSRYVIELFPAFVLLATLGRNKYVNYLYLMGSGAVLFFLLTQFLTGHWVL